MNKNFLIQLSASKLRDLSWDLKDHDGISFWQELLPAVLAYASHCDQFGVVDPNRVSDKYYCKVLRMGMKRFTRIKGYLKENGYIKLTQTRNEMGYPDGTARIELKCDFASFFTQFGTPTLTEGSPKLPNGRNGQNYQMVVLPNEHHYDKDNISIDKENRGKSPQSGDPDGSPDVSDETKTNTGPREKREETIEEPGKSQKKSEGNRENQEPMEDTPSQQDTHVSGSYLLPCSINGVQIRIRSQEEEGVKMKWAEFLGRSKKDKSTKDTPLRMLREAAVETDMGIDDYTNHLLDHIFEQVVAEPGKDRKNPSNRTVIAWIRKDTEFVNWHPEAKQVDAADVRNDYLIYADEIVNFWKRMFPDHYPMRPAFIKNNADTAERFLSEDKITLIRIMSSHTYRASELMLFSGMVYWCVRFNHCTPDDQGNPLGYWREYNDGQFEKQRLREAVNNLLQETAEIVEVNQKAYHKLSELAEKYQLKLEDYVAN